VEYRILGPLQVLVPGREIALGGPRQRSLLAVLTLHPNEVVSRERLIDEIWGESPPASAARALNVHVSQLRKVLRATGADPIATHSSGYALEVEAEEIDATRFRRLVAEAQAHVDAGELEEAALGFTEALALWRGPVLAGVGLESFGRNEAEQLDELRMAAVMDRIDCRLALGRHEGLVGELEVLVAQQPLRERLRRQQMLALYRSGRQADALRAYRDARRFFVEELGLEPSPELHLLETQILNHDPVLGAPVTRAASRALRTLDGSVVCPFKGLAAFDSGDSELFFGRERARDALLRLLQRGRFAGLVGASGAGKSSLLHAGLLPAIRTGLLLPGSERWTTVLMRPGEHPGAELWRRLQGETLAVAVERLQSGERILLVIDQLEELFVSCADEHERFAFLETLVTATADPAGRSAVVVGLRADHYGRCTDYRPFGELLNGSHLLLGPMDGEELARAIALPAERAGLDVERRLVEALVHDVDSEPGSLPLLSTTLVELWHAREGRLLTLAGYRRSGGVRGAIARLAEESYAHLTAEQRAAARRLLLRLVSTDDRIVGRRRVARSELDLAQDPLAASVVARLTEDRLLTAQEATVEIAHEALLREWPRFQEWLAADAAGRALREQLTESAGRWQESGRDPSELYRGARLAATLDWAEQREAELNELERAFLDHSRAEAELEADRQRRAIRRLRLFAGGIAVLLLAAVAAGSIALVLRSTAQRAATRAEAERLGAQALVQSDLDRALLLAREGVNLDDSTATRSNLLAALLKSPDAIGVMRPLPSRLVGAIGISHDGRRLLVGNDAGMFAVIDTDTRRVVRRFGPAAAAALSPDGQRVILLDQNGRMRFEQIETGRIAHEPGRLSAAALQTFRNGFGIAAFSPDLKTFAVPLGGGTQPGSAGVLLFSTAPVHVIARLPRIEPAQPYLWVTFSPDGKYLIAGEPHPPPPSNASDVVSVWRLGNDRAPRAIFRGDISTAALSQDDHQLAVGRADGSVGLSDLRTGARRTLSGRHDGFVDSVTFSPDDRTVVSTGDDGRVIAQAAEGSGPATVLTGHQGRVWSAVFSADGKTLYSDSTDGTIIAWDPSGRRTLGRMVTADAGNVQFAATPMAASQAELAFGQSDGKIVLRDAASLRRLRVLAAGGAVNTLAFSPDSRLLATESHLGAGACHGALALLWDTRTGHRIGRLPIPRAALKHGGPCADLEAFAFSPDGSLVAGGYDTGETFVWQTRSRVLDGAPLRPPPGGAATGVAFSPDGTLLAVALEGETILYRLQDRRPLHILNSGEGSRAVAFSPGGRLLATGGGTETINFWDVRTGRPAGRSILEANRCQIDSLQFSPDGRTLLAAGCDGGARLYDVASRTEIGTPLQAQTDVGRVAASFAHDTSEVVVGYVDGRAAVWNTDPSAWERHACTVAGRNLTHAEWAQFLPDRPYRPVCKQLLSRPQHK
jgi:WD40 repeat protein/DNA-binding SARP family transcriptional activator